MNTVYKIRRISDGLFSTGSVRPRFSRAGKIWNSIGTLKRHLSNFNMNFFEHYYNNCEIVEYIENAPISINAVMAEAEVRRLELNRQRQERTERLRRERLEFEQERLRRAQEKIALDLAAIYSNKE